MADIHVFIVEDQKLAELLTRQYFGEGITYAALFKKENRSKITEALDQIEE